MVLLLVSGSALAQDKDRQGKDKQESEKDKQSLGLDLTDDVTKDEQPKKNEAQKPEQAAKPPGARPEVEKAAPAADLGERDIIQEDRVKSVQRKVYLKKHRFELAPSVSTSINDPYYSKYAVNVRGAYYFADTFALAARFSSFQWIGVVPNDDVRTAKRNFQSRIFYSVPQWSAIADLEWSPLYGKVAMFNSILHFDAYLVGGAGVMQTETSALPGRGLNPAVDLGIGMRVVAKDFVAVNVALVNTTYVDQPAGTTKGAIQNLMMLGAGLSVFLPFKSTGREAE
jgi:outer membrane beta-barrel protein